MYPIIKSSNFVCKVDYRSASTFAMIARTSTTTSTHHSSHRPLPCPILIETWMSKVCYVYELFLFFAVALLWKF